MIIKIHGPFNGYRRGDVVDFTGHEDVGQKLLYDLGPQRAEVLATVDAAPPAAIIGVPNDPKPELGVFNAESAVAQDDDDDDD